MKITKLLLIIFLSAFISTTYGQSTIFKINDFTVYQKIHKKIAIIPIDITVDSKSMPRDLTVADLDKLHQGESMFLQDYFFAVNLNENQNDKMSVEIQDVRKTNTLLDKNNINFFNISKVSKEDIAKFCEVDALVVVFFYKSNQIVNERPRNTLDSRVAIFDKYGKLLWEYYDTVFASGDKNTLYLEKLILEKAAKKMPYRDVIKEVKPK
ncbi:MAG: hypothetical protein ACOYO1_03580 [Bacteroidales bacterium]